MSTVKFYPFHKFNDVPQFYDNLMQPISTKKDGTQKVLAYITTSLKFEGTHIRLAENINDVHSVHLNKPYEENESGKDQKRAMLYWSKDNHKVYNFFHSIEEKVKHDINKNVFSWGFGLRYFKKYHDGPLYAPIKASNPNGMQKYCFTKTKHLEKKDITKIVSNLSKDVLWKNMFTSTQEYPNKDQYGKEFVTNVLVSMNEKEQGITYNALVNAFASRIAFDDFTLQSMFKGNCLPYDDDMKSNGRLPAVKLTFIPKPSENRFGSKYTHILSKEQKDITESFDLDSGFKGVNGMASVKCGLRIYPDKYEVALYADLGYFLICKRDGKTVPEKREGCSVIERVLGFSKSTIKKELIRRQNLYKESLDHKLTMGNSDEDVAKMFAM